MTTTCVDCHSANTEPCAACGQPVCRSHRAGLGSLSDGYTCKNCHGYGFGGFASAAATPQPGRWLSQQHQGWPRWLIGVGVLIFLLMLVLAVGHSSR